MKNRFGGLLRAFFGIKIRFWAFILVCAICVAATYGLTVRGERDRIGSGDNYSVFWDIRRKGRNQVSHFFKIFTGQFQEHTYPLPDTQITIGANSKTVVWKGIMFKMTKGRLTVS